LRNENAITATITSPPYGALKNYGEHGQIGWAQTHDQYLQDCGEVFAALHDHSKSNGTLWIVADTIRNHVSANQAVRGSQIEPLPFQLAEQAQKAGWLLQDVIIWRKDRTLPWSGKGRLRNGFEYIIQLVMGKDFKYNIDRLRTPVNDSEWSTRFPERFNPDGIAPTNVWDIPIPKQGAWAQDVPRHACPLPEELVDRLLYLSTDPGDVVFDPFAGIGTVVSRANALGRKGAGLELNREFVNSYKSAEPLFKKTNPSTASEISTVRLQNRQLRALKFARVITDGILIDPTYTGPKPLAAISLIDSRRRVNHPNVVWARNFVIASGSGLPLLQDRIESIAKRRPASKYGVEGPIVVVRRSQLAKIGVSNKLYYYLDGRFWHSRGRSTVNDLLDSKDSNRIDRHLPLLSNVRAMYADNSKLLS